MAAHYRYAKPAAQQLTKVTLPSGRVASETVYDTATDRVKEYTDEDGGTWKIGPPTIYGGDNDLRRSIQVLDPANRPYLLPYDALAGRLLRSGTPLGLETRAEDRPGEPTTPPSPPPTETCTQPDPNDTRVLHHHPRQLRRTGLRAAPARRDGDPHLLVRPGRLPSRVTDGNKRTSVEMTYDSRGRMATRKTCRTSTSASPATTPTRPASPTHSTPGLTSRSTSATAGASGPTDNRYRTSHEVRDRRAADQADQPGRQPGPALVHHRW